MTITAGPGAAPAPVASAPVAAAPVGLDADSLKIMLEAITDYIRDAIPDARLLQLDHDDECPIDVVRGMCSDELGIQLL
ncbi:MAG TPA: hypothetical protein VLX31_19175, partial [Streptosporangiaceae bacterium]|nr:hypothetical protein [Streptosporangiaceae bacterium]